MSFTPGIVNAFKLAVMGLTKENYASVCSKLGFGTSSKENKQYTKQKNEN